MRYKSILAAAAVLAVLCATAFAVWSRPEMSLKRVNGSSGIKSPKIALMYTTDRYKQIPDPDMFTHLVYSFAVFNDANDGVVIRYPDKLQALADLKKLNPELKVILGLGGYKRDGFSEMARDRKKRKAYVKSVKNVIDAYGLDGVDLDWEFPTTEAGGHTATPKDDRNYVSLVRDLRKALGKEKWISY